MGRGISPSLRQSHCQRSRRVGLKSDTWPAIPSKLHSNPTCSKSRPRAISTGQLNALLRLHRPPIDVVVFHGPYSLEVIGNLISRWASRLDAFSGYPI